MSPSYQYQNKEAQSGNFKTGAGTTMSRDTVFGTLGFGTVDQDTLNKINDFKSQDKNANLVRSGDMTNARPLTAYSASNQYVKDAQGRVISLEEASDKAQQYLTQVSEARGNTALSHADIRAYVTPFVEGRPDAQNAFDTAHAGGEVRNGVFYSHGDLLMNPNIGKPTATTTTTTTGTTNTDATKNTPAKTSDTAPAGGQTPTSSPVSPTTVLGDWQKIMATMYPGRQDVQNQITGDMSKIAGNLGDTSAFDNQWRQDVRAGQGARGLTMGLDPITEANYLGQQRLGYQGAQIGQLGALGSIGLPGPSYDALGNLNLGAGNQNLGWANMFSNQNLGYANLGENQRQFNLGDYRQTQANTQAQSNWQKGFDYQQANTPTWWQTALGNLAGGVGRAVI